MITRAIHVFASDILPFPGCPRTAGSNRSMQLVTGLRRAGHHVTFSMPLDTHLAKANYDRILPFLTKEELWACENAVEPDIVLNRIEPEIAITCNVNKFRASPKFAKNVVQMLDLYGPVQFEDLLLLGHSSTDGRALQEPCKEMVSKFESVDYIITVSERQKYFWSAYCSLAGFSFADLNLLVCPAAFEAPPVARKPSPQLNVVYSGGFYPWQNPNRFLEEAATALDSFEGAILHVFGGPHTGLANEADVRRFLTDLQKHRSVRYHGYRPMEEVLETLSQAWCALELMERNIERELAITGRTLEFLSTGTPVIYNNYSTLSRLIEQYNAGWTVPVEGAPQLKPIFRELVERGLPLVEELSSNANKLAAEEFSAEKAIAPLAEFCGSPGLSARASRSTTRQADSQQNGQFAIGAKRSPVGRVLAISPDAAALLDLRLRNPLRALHRQGLLNGTTFASCSLEQLQHDHTAYDVIVTQRALPQQLYDLLESLSLRFLLDVDDNLMAHASYRFSGKEYTIISGLRACAAVTAPNPRLIRGLERYTHLSIAQKAFMTPNALPFADASLERPAQAPSQIIWIQSDIAALVASRDGIVDAVEKFSNKHGLPIVLVGRNVLARPQFRNQIVMGEIDFTANLQLLATAPLSLGVAPLETQSDEETLDFVAGKSDLKILLFAGYGHAGVYSAAPPYTDSKLQGGLSVIGNSAAEWHEALEYEFREGWKNISRIAREIQSERNIDKVARENWLPALEASRLSRPITGAELYEAYRSYFDMGRTPIRSIAYLLGNEDVLSYCMKDRNYTAWRHYVEHGRAEHRQLRHNLSEQKQMMARVEREGAEAIAEVGAQIQRLKDERECLREETRRLSDERADMARKLSDIFQSKSWRLTAPLRALAQRGKGSSR